MAQLNALFRSLVDTGLSVDRLVERSNRFFAENRVHSHYATLVCGQANGKGEVEICNAGHCRPLVSRSGRVEEVDPTGFPVGLFGESPYEGVSFKLEPGDILLLYTDGLVEARNAREEEYGTERLKSMLAERRALSPPLLAAACLDDLGAFRGGQPWLDDVALLVLRRSGG
jgi:sigma-B regulation protein RsbU (phosphoserine phosphatase)